MGKRLSFFYKLNNRSKPSYLCNVIPKVVSQYITRNQPPVCNFTPRTDLFSFSFFPYTVRTWNVLDPSIRNLPSLSAFKNSLFKFIRPSPSSTYSVHHPLGIKLATRLRMGLSHLREHKFRHNFRDTINPLCPCSIEPETTAHYLLRCHLFTAHRKILYDSLDNIDVSLTTMNDESLVKCLLYGLPSFSTETNAKVLKALISFIINSGRFSENLI